MGAYQDVNQKEKEYKNYLKEISSYNTTPKKDFYYSIENNVIYYDQHYHYERQDEIYSDAEKFKQKTTGTFIFITNMTELELVMKEIVLEKEKTSQNFQFDLICTGTASEEVFSFLTRNYEYNCIIKRACLFTTHYNDYKNMPSKYPTIKGVYTNNDQVIEFIKQGEYSTKGYRVACPFTYEDYEKNFINLHKIIAKHYGNTSISEYEKAYRLAEKFLDDPGEYKLMIRTHEWSKKDAMLKVLRIFKDVEKNYEEIIRNYTEEFDSFHQDFNEILNNLYIEAIIAFAWFIANTMYALNKYAKKNSSVALKEKKVLFRGRYIGIIDLLNYERFKDQVLVFPAFTSTSCLQNIADDFNKLYQKRSTKIEEGKFSVLLVLNYRYEDNKGVVPITTNVQKLSVFDYEAEYLFQPFTFYKIKDIKIDLRNHEARMDLELYFKKDILEQKLKNGETVNLSSDFKELTGYIYNMPTFEQMKYFMHGVFNMFS